MLEDGALEAARRERYAGWERAGRSQDARAGEIARRARGGRGGEGARSAAALGAAGAAGEPRQSLHLRERNTAWGAMKTIKGPGTLPGAVRRRRGAVQLLGHDRAVGGGLRLRRRADAELGRAPVRSRQGGGEPRPTATRSHGVARGNGVAITELSTHLQGQLVAVHPAYDEVFDGFAAPEVRGNPKARSEWAVDQVQACRNGIAQSRARRDRDVLRRAGLAVPLSVAAASGGPRRDGVRRAGRALAPDPRSRSTSAASTSASRSIPARTCTTA